MQPTSHYSAPSNTFFFLKVRDGTRWTPSRIIKRLGKEIDNPESVYYWAAANDIPVFCPAITDGSLGDMMYFHSYKRPEFVCDVVDDIRAINDIAVRAPCTGMVILGGGVIKHHACNANLMRNGAEFSVYINTGQVIPISSTLDEYIIDIVCYLNDRSSMEAMPVQVLMKLCLGGRLEWMPNLSKSAQMLH